MRVDLNCDCGEGSGQDAAIMPFVTSVNIACGGHAGDAGTMRETARLAREHGVEIGAHPGYEDRENFGRQVVRLDQGEARALLRRQLDALREVTPFTHVKPHGAFYNEAARDPALAREMAEAVREWDASLLLFALAESALASAGRAAGLRVAEEAFADRAYLQDGSLAPRSQPGAVIEDEEQAVGQALMLVTEGRVRAVGGSLVAVRADTLCLHGDGIHAAAFARRLREALTAAGVAVAAPGASGREL